MKIFLRSVILIPLGMGMTFLLHLLIARSLTPEEFGLINYTLAILSITVVLISGGLPVSAPKFLPSYDAQDCNCLRSGYIKFSFIWISVAGFLGSLILCALYIRTENKVFLYGSLMIIPMTFWIWQRYIALGLDNIILAILPRDILYPVVSIIIILLFNVKSPLQIVLLLFISYTLFITIGIYKVYKQLRTLKQCEHKKSQFEIKIWLKTSIPMMLTSLMVLGLNSWDLIILGLFVSMEDVGKYSAALRLALAAGIAVRIINVALSQKISKLFAGEEIKEMKSMIQKAFILSFFLSLLIAGGMALYSKELLTLLGSEYTDAYLIMWILLSGQLVSGALGPSMSVLNMLGQEKFIAASLLKWSIASLLLYYLVIPYAGLIGASIITALTITAMRIEQTNKLLTTLKMS